MFVGWNIVQWIYVIGVMAIFEKTLQTKAVVDDTENLICTVENAQNINKHTVSTFWIDAISSRVNHTVIEFI